MKKFVLFFIFIGIGQNINSQTRFQKFVGGSGYSKFNDIVKTSTGYISVGVTNSNGAGQKDFFVMHTDFNGSKIWSKTFGGNYDEEAFSVINTSDGNVLIAGTTNSFSLFPNDSSNFYVVKIDLTGTLIWSKSFGGSGSDIAKSIVETHDHNYLIAGSTNSIGSGCTDVYLLELDSSGNYIWSKSLGSTGCESASDLVELGDGGFLITGSTSSFSLGGTVVYLLKSDSIGDFKWVKTYDLTGTFSTKKLTANKIIRGYTNDFLIVGSRGLGSIGDSHPTILNVDSLGAINWAKSYYFNTGNCEGSSIDKTTTGGFVVGGWQGNYAPALLKIDSIGQLIWSQIYGNPTTTFNDGKCINTVTSNDGGFISAGMLYDVGDTVALLLKIDINGNITCPHVPPFSNNVFTLSMIVTPQTYTSSFVNLNLIDSCVVLNSSNNFATYCSSVGVNELFNPEGLSCYPNPFSENLTISFDNNDHSEIIIYDIALRKLLQQNFTNSVIINTSQFTKGIYIYEVRNATGIIKKGKVIKE